MNREVGRSSDWSFGHPLCEPTSRPLAAVSSNRVKRLSQYCSFIWKIFTGFATNLNSTIVYGLSIINVLFFNNGLIFPFSGFVTYVKLFNFLLKQKNDSLDVSFP